ncbi:hypothetical protein M3G54_01795 [Brevibacterium casei]|uniref:hypothetical protein n=1 Tax=Brevibacterium casei TaxID=33889 RepID=UPI00223A9799|nr:hypothetical protein [Brevibacterium casei]MCT2357097.1 hypothetical protein [Brevibacterium casei]
MITLTALAQELGTTTEQCIETPVRWDHIADFDQTLPTGIDGDYEITEADADAIREAWNA